MDDQLELLMNPSGKHGAKSPLDFSRTKSDYDDHSPLHNEEEELDILEATEDDVENELLVVSEEEEKQKMFDDIAENKLKRTYRYEEDSLGGSAEHYKDEYDNVFDESFMYNELAKMEKAERIESVADLIETKPVVDEKKEEEFDLLGRPMKLYANPKNQPVYAIGKTQISHSQAKLFHLFDKNGEICAENIKNRSVSSNEKTCDVATFKKSYSRMKSLATPREIDTSMVVVEEDKELTFQPMRSKQAEMAMRNKSCGYDFVDRLKANGDFLTRNANSDKNQKTKNLNLESLKDDYKALLDKLICPSCKSEQSFDENYEKIRECRRCNEKFVKSKTSNSISFERKNKENEEKRVSKLKSVEESIYGNLGQLPVKIGYPLKLKQKISLEIDVANYGKNVENENENDVSEIREIRSKIRGGKFSNVIDKKSTAHVERERKSKHDSNYSKNDQIDDSESNHINKTKNKRNDITNSYDKNKNDLNRTESRSGSPTKIPKKTTTPKKKKNVMNRGEENEKTKGTLSMSEKFRRLVS